MFDIFGFIEEVLVLVDKYQIRSATAALTHVESGKKLHSKPLTTVSEESIVGWNVDGITLSLPVQAIEEVRPEVSEPTPEPHVDIE